jgi:hypothetical protein
LYITTYSGRDISLAGDVLPEDIDILDIAHSLSLQCRYNGACKFFYSVAQHSEFVSRHVPPEDALAALLHDAEEAYTSDMTTPLKKWYRAFATEWRQIMIPEIPEEHKNIPPYDEIIYPMHPEAAKKIFLDRYKELTGETM